MNLDDAFTDSFDEQLFDAFTPDIEAKIDRIWTNEGPMYAIFLEIEKAVGMLSNDSVGKTREVREKFTSPNKADVIQEALFETNFKDQVKELAREELRPRQFKALKQMVD